MNHGLVLSMRPFFVVGMGLFDEFDWDVCSNTQNGLQWRMVDMEDNSKLVAFRLSIWHYKVAFDGFVVSMWHDNFTSKIVDEKAWEGIQFIGKGLRDGGLRCKERWRLKEGSD